jgi:hypothetical protein
MANMLEGGGKTPILTPAELQAMGFSLVAYPLSLLAVSIKAMQDALGGLKTGTVPGPRQMGTFVDLQMAVGFPVSLLAGHNVWLQPPSPCLCRQRVVSVATSKAGIAVGGGGQQLAAIPALHHALLMPMGRIQFQQLMERLLTHCLALLRPPKVLVCCICLQEYYEEEAKYAISNVAPGQPSTTTTSSSSSGAGASAAATATAAAGAAAAAAATPYSSMSGEGSSAAGATTASSSQADASNSASSSSDASSAAAAGADSEMNGPVVEADEVVLPAGECWGTPDPTTLPPVAVASLSVDCTHATCNTCFACI